MRIVFTLLFCSLITAISSQDKYWVFLSDKDGVEFNPTEYFNQKAINRRLKNNITLNHLTDRPIRDDYRNEISNIRYLKF